MVAEKPFL